MIRLKKGLASHYWEEIVLAIIGEQFDVGNEICGAVCRCVCGPTQLILHIHHYRDKTPPLGPLLFLTLESII